MKILVDTNILFSALLFPDSVPAKALFHVVENHEMFLCDQNIKELEEILTRKAPEYLPAAKEFIRDMSFKQIAAVNRAEKEIRDATDQPILDAAISHHVDIILTGDKDFLSLNMERPKCLTAAQFLEKEEK